MYGRVTLQILLLLSGIETGQITLSTSSSEGTQNISWPLGCSMWTCQSTHCQKPKGSAKVHHSDIPLIRPPWRGSVHQSGIDSVSSTFYSKPTLRPWSQRIIWLNSSLSTYSVQQQGARQKWPSLTVTSRHYYWWPRKCILLCPMKQGTWSKHSIWPAELFECLLYMVQMLSNQLWTLCKLTKFNVWSN